MLAVASVPPGAELGRILRSAYSTVQANVRRVGDVAHRRLDRVADAAERYVGAKIKRRVKPPIVMALAVAGVALAVAVIALGRK